MNDYICCLLGICCAFASTEQFEKLVGMLMKRKRFAIRADAENRARRDIEWAKGFREMVAE